MVHDHSRANPPDPPGLREGTREQADEADFRALIQRHEGVLSRLCRHYESAPEARRDLQQEILVALWRAREGFRGECSEKTWVARIAHNVAASHVARAMRSKVETRAEVITGHDGAKLSSALDALDSAELPDTQLDQRNALERLRARIRTLDLVSQQVILLALEGCTSGEIAEITGLSPTNVTTRLSRIRTFLTRAEKEENP
ncbi:MAG: sigma-70 family RNA polymerase sigma factor [Polyangiaceae bacterium]